MNNEFRIILKEPEAINAGTIKDAGWCPFVVFRFDLIG